MKPAHSSSVLVLALHWRGGNRTSAPALWFSLGTCITMNAMSTGASHTS